MKREQLKELGLSDEQIESVIGLHGKTVSDITSQLKTAQDEAKQYQNQLTETSKTLQSLEEKTKDNPDVQKLLADEKAAREAAEKELSDMRVSTQVKEALTKAGAKDVDYALFKLGQLETNKDGSVKDLDNKIKDLQANLPDYFAAVDDKGGKADDNGGYKPIDNKLGAGGAPVTLSRAEIEKMTPEQINENWEAVSAALGEGGNE